MIDIIIGNICGLGAMICDSLSGLRKTQREILLVQCISQIFYITGNIVLKGYSAVAQNVVAVIRNIFAANGKCDKALERTFIFLPVILGFVFNNRSWLGLLPIIANLEYSIAMFTFSDEPLKLKYAFIINSALFCVFNFAILNFVGGVSSIVISVTTGISAMKEKKSAEAGK